MRPTHYLNESSNWLSSICMSNNIVSVTIWRIKRVVIFWFNWRNNASKSLSFLKKFEVFSKYLNCNKFLFHNLFQIENSLVLAQAPNLNVLPAAASYLDSEALLPFAKLKQVRNLVYLIMVKNIGMCDFKEVVLLLHILPKSQRWLLWAPCTQGFWTKCLDKIITSLNSVSDAKYHQRALRSVLVHKPELLG